MLAYTEVRDREVEAAGEWFLFERTGISCRRGLFII